MSSSKLLLALASIVGATPALACIPPAPMGQLPGESDQAFQERAKAAVEAQNAESRRLLQLNLLDKSAAVFVGVVTQSREIAVDQVKGHEVTVRPLQAIKGDLPGQPITVRDTVFTDCGLGGGGSATTAQIGDYVILFAGLPKTELEQGRIGILAKDAQLPDLLNAVAHYALVSRQAQVNPSDGMRVEQAKGGH